MIKPEAKSSALSVWGPINTERALDFASGFISLRLIENQMEGFVYLNLSFEEQGQTWEMRVAGPFSASVP